MKILVVEDDSKVAGFIEHGLKDEGHVVDVARDGDEATMLAHVNEYDIILLDVLLPKKSGFQIATELRREGRSTPMLMLTSRDGRVAYQIEDEGPGVTPSEVERIFEIYVTKADEESHGLGLGLPLSRRLARLLGGELHAVSKARKGGCFVLEVLASAS